MSIDQAQVIDILGISKADGCCVLTISDHREWNDSEHLLALQEKLNSYLAFIESGEIYETRPDAREREIEISIHCKYSPEGSGDLQFLQLARDTIEGAGYRFSVISRSGEHQITNTEANSAAQTTASPSSGL